MQLLTHGRLVPANTDLDGCPGTLFLLTASERVQLTPYAVAYVSAWSSSRERRMAWKEIMKF